jgi:hypothetical protein
LQAVEQKFKQELSKLEAQASNSTNSTTKGKNSTKPTVASVEMLVQQSGADGAAMDQPKPQADYHQYLSKFAGPYMQDMPSAEGADDSSQNYDLEACAKLQQRVTVGDTALVVPMVLATARMCEKEKELRALRACQEAQVDRSVPAAYKRFAIKKIEAQFQERLAQLKHKGNSSALAASSAEEVPVLLVTAKRCESKGELRAWRAHQLKEVDDYVPKAYKKLARHTIERTFAQHLARLQEQGKKAAQGEGAASGAAEQTKSKADKKVGVAPIALDASTTEKLSSTAPRHIRWALGFVLLGLMTPAFIAAFSRRLRTPSSDGYFLKEDDETV